MQEGLDELKDVCVPAPEMEEEHQEPTEVENVSLFVLMFTL